MTRTTPSNTDSRTDDASRFLLGCVGAGQMGAGIAATAVTHGLSAVVRDVASANLDVARARVVKAAERADLSGPAMLDQWSGTTGWAGFEATDMVIEAVFELPDLKRQTLEQISQVVAAETLIATNTSAISIASLADSVRDPRRFLGMHFFSPVEKMPLVELVPHAGTAPETIDRATELVHRLGKTPVVVADVPGFFTSRVYARWLIEGTRLLLDGASSEQIDAEAREVGFPVGPLQAHDEATLDLVLKASLIQTARPVMADRIDVDSVEGALTTLIEKGVAGRRQGGGFYTYIDGRRSGPDTRIAELLGVAPRPLPEGLAGERLLLAFLSEALLCWDDGTICHPADGDVASVLGIGFPQALTGPFHYVDEVGPADMVERLEQLDSPAFPIAPSLRDLATSGSRYADQARRAKPGAPV